MKRVKVDMIKCQNHGQCAITAPSQFSLEDGSLRYSDVVDESNVADVENAADVCPMQAIELSD